MVKSKQYLWKHPSGRWYVRRSGQYLAIKSVPGTPEFDHEYWEVMTGKRLQKQTSWAVLMKDYRCSARWEGLMPRTRLDYEKVMVYLEEKIGTRDVTVLTRADVIAAQKANMHRVRFANYIPQMLVNLCEHAIDLGWISSNPAKGVRRLKTPDSKKQEHVPWPDWAVDLFRSKATWIELLIFEIGVGTIQRPSDWVEFRWSDFDGETLSLRQNKTGVHLKLPCTMELKAVLLTERSQLTAPPIGNVPILKTKAGTAMSYRYMAQIMLGARKRMGLEAFDQHALRYRGVMELAWAGCSDEEIKSFSGHATDEMVRKYAGEARQIMRARQAATKRK
jgi:integrase